MSTQLNGFRRAWHLSRNYRPSVAWSFTATLLAVLVRAAWGDYFADSSPTALDLSHPLIAFPVALVFLGALFLLSAARDARRTAEHSPD